MQKMNETTEFLQGFRRHKADPFYFDSVSSHRACTSENEFMSLDDRWAGQVDLQ